MLSIMAAQFAHYLAHDTKASIKVYDVSLQDLLRPSVRSCGYSPCSKGSSNPLSTASTPSDNLIERKFTFKKPMLLSEIHTCPPCPARSGLVDTQFFHLNFKSNYTSSSRHFHSDRRFRPGVGRLPETLKDFGNVDKEPTFLAHKQKGIDGNFSQSKVFPKIPGECPCSNND